MKKVNILILFLLITVLTACSLFKGVTIEENELSIKEADCSILSPIISEITYDKVEYFFDDSEKKLYSENDSIHFYQVRFIHTGEHAFSDVVFNKSTLKFEPSSEISYYFSDGTQPTIIATSGDLSSAYMIIHERNTLQNCTFEHKGYSFEYNFETNEWSYSVIAESEK